MKKLFAIVIALAMLLSMASLAEAADVVGTWYLNEVVADGTSMSPAVVGMSMSMTLNEDGTAQVAAAIPGEEDDTAQTGTWTMDGDTVTVTVDGSDQAFTYADDQLTVDSDGMGMVFGRENTAEPPYEPAAPVAADSADAFAGSWTATKVGFEGTYMDYSVMSEMLGDPLTANIEGTTVTLNGFLFDNQALGTTLEDGALVYTAEDTENEIVAKVTVQMLEDGLMALTMSIEGDAVFILQKDA